MLFQFTDLLQMLYVQVTKTPLLQHLSTSFGSNESTAGLFGTSRAGDGLPATIKHVKQVNVTRFPMYMNQVFYSLPVDLTLGLVGGIFVGGRGIPLFTFCQKSEILMKKLVKC